MASFKRALVLAACSLAAANGEWEQLQYSASHYEWMRSTRCTNMNEVNAGIGFPNKNSDPYPSLGYDTTIDPDMNCYVVFPSEGERQEYRLETARHQDMVAANKTALGWGTHFLTHTTPCGSCSDLKNLATYLSVTDLTNPVRSCGLKLIEGNAISCLEDVGFRDHCTWIWYWNTKNTKKTAGNGGCMGTCLIHINSPNIMESGGSGGNPCSTSECPNTINGGNACSDDQWQNGPYRLNPCLQCDECRSGPIFQKVAGRTRRASGIPSAIARPPNDVSFVTHVYGKWRTGFVYPTPSPVPPTFKPTQGPVTSEPTTLAPTMGPTAFAPSSTARPSPNLVFNVGGDDTESSDSPMGMIFGILGGFLCAGAAAVLVISKQRKKAAAAKNSVVSPEDKAMANQVIKFGWGS